MSITSDVDHVANPRRIRSKHRRRLISRLADGDSTVSKLAADTCLRVPHASAEIRRMREEDLISSDLPPGSRGSQIRLTENGWRVLQEDEWSKVLKLPEPSSDQENCCLIFRDDSDLLLGFQRAPDASLIPIPNKPPPENMEVPLSIRNQGVSWTWAVLSEKSPRWFDISNLTIIDNPPDLANPERIEAYVGQPRVIGLMRAKLIDSDRTNTISPGVWFAPPLIRPDPPLEESTYHRGSWVLGSPHEKSPDIRPTMPIAVIISERLPRSVLLRAARQNSLVIADLGGLESEGRALPLSALDYWIGIAHPRLSKKEKQKRLQSLKGRISSSKRVKTDDSTLRRFRKDWGISEFSSEESSISSIDLRGLGRSATESLIRWSMDVEDLPLVIEINNDLPSDLLYTISSHPNLRLVFLNEKLQQFSDFDIVEIDRLRTLPWLRFSTKSGKTIPLKLIEKAKVLDSSSESEILTISPWEIMEDSSEAAYDPVVLEGDMVSIVGSAISQFPRGDEEWANQMEARYPLASWIASPQKNRWPRWQRISNRLDPEWLALLDIDHLPIDKISQLADNAPDSVLKVFSSKMTSKLRQDPENLLRSWPAIDPMEANRGAAWLASIFIKNSPWLPSEHYNDLIEWGVEAWLSEPPNESIGALIGVSWLFKITGKSDQELDEIFRKIRNRSADLDDSHQLRTWSRLYDLTIVGKEVDLDSIQYIRRDLPFSWWAPISSEMLSFLLDINDADELLKFNSPWCATILRPIGEVCDAPGLSSVSHSGCDPNLLKKISDYLRSLPEDFIDNEDLRNIIDLFEALKSARSKTPPISGETHNLAGWLAQPSEKWPEFTIEMMMEGERSVSERLILGKSGFHEGLSQM